MAAPYSQPPNFANGQGQPVYQNQDPRMASPSPQVQQNPGFGIQRRPLSTSFQKLAGQPSLPSPVSPPNNNVYPVYPQVTQDAGAGQYFPPPPPGGPPPGAQFSQQNMYQPAPPTTVNASSMQPSAQPGGPNYYFAPPPGQSVPPTPPSATQAGSPQQYFPPPPSQQAAVPAYNPSAATQSPYAAYSPAQSYSPASQSPGGYGAPPVVQSPGSYGSPPAVPSPAATINGGAPGDYGSPTHMPSHAATFNGTPGAYGSPPLAQSPAATVSGAPVPPPRPQGSRSSSDRLSKYLNKDAAAKYLNKEVAAKYLNKENAKKAYQSSKTFLVKTNDKLEKVIEPMMPVLAITHPDIAIMYQLGQQQKLKKLQKDAEKADDPQLQQELLKLKIEAENSQQHGSIQSPATGLPIGQGAQATTAVPNQPSSGLDNLGSLLAALNQPNAGGPSSGQTDTNALMAAYLQQQQNAATTNLLASMNANNQAASPYQNVIPQTQIPSTGQVDQSQLIAAFLQQQQNAAATNLLATIDNNQAAPPYQNIVPQAEIQSADQDVQSQLINALFQQQQSQSVDVASLTTSTSLSLEYDTPIQMRAPSPEYGVPIQMKTPSPTLYGSFEPPPPPPPQHEAQSFGQQIPVTGVPPLPYGVPHLPSGAPPLPSAPPIAPATGVPHMPPALPIALATEAPPLPPALSTAPATEAPPLPPALPIALASPALPIAPASVSTQNSFPVPLPEAVAWVVHRAGVYGLGEVLLPPNHGLREVANNILVGDLVTLSGHFEIKLLYTAAQVMSDVASMQSLTSDEDTTLFEPFTTTNFGIPTGVSVTCALRTNEADENGVITSMYRAIVQSPFGHGIAVSFFVPSQYFALLKATSRSMLSSIKWLDRATLCRSVSGQLVGKWRYYDTLSSVGGLGVGGMTETKELTFVGDGRYAYDRECSVSVSTQDADASAYDPNHTGGKFEAYVYEGGVVHLILAEDGTGSVEVQPVELGSSVMIVRGKKYFKIVE